MPASLWLGEWLRPYSPGVVTMLYRGKVDQCYCPVVILKLQVTCWRVTNSSGVQGKTVVGKEGGDVDRWGLQSGDWVGVRIGPE